MHSISNNYQLPQMDRATLMYIFTEISSTASCDSGLTATDGMCGVHDSLQ